MYAVVTRRTMNPERVQETRERASRELWPKVQRTPGFVSFTLVQGEDGVNTSIFLWETRAQAEAFREEARRWWGALDGFGHRVASEGGGEVVQHLTAGG